MSRSTGLQYDASGNLKTLTSAAGAQHKFGYDPRNYQNSETDPLGQSEAVQFDANHNPKQQLYRPGRTRSLHRHPQDAGQINATHNK